MKRGRFAHAVLALLAAAPAGGCAGIERLESVPYDDRYGRATTMDVYLPDDGGGGRPGVLVVHGGGWRIGDKESQAAMARRLARSGFVTAAINYRLVPDGAFPAAVQDVKCALVFMRSMAPAWGLDPAHIAVTGYSAGGHLAALVALSEGVPELEPDCDAIASGEPARVAAAIPAAGVYDFRSLPRIEVVTRFLGGTEEEVPGAYSLASPVFHVGPSAPPVLLVHGSYDLFVPFDQAERLYEAMSDAGGDVRLLRIPGGSHLVQPGVDPGSFAFGISHASPEGWAATIDFLYETLGAP